MEVKKKRGGRGQGRKNRVEIELLDDYFIVSFWCQIFCEDYSLKGAIQRAADLFAVEPSSTPIGVFKKSEEGRIFCLGLALSNEKKLLVNERPHPGEKTTFFLERMKTQYSHNKLSHTPV